MTQNLGETNSDRDEKLAGIYRELCEQRPEDFEKLQRRLDELDESELADLLGAGHCQNLLLEAINDGPRAQASGSASDQDSHSNLGRFSQLQLIAEGGFAKIYKGYDDKLDRYVAVKIPHKLKFNKFDSLARFQREARVVAALSHPAIVPVYEVSCKADQTFIAFEWIPGINLKAFLEGTNEELPVREIATAVRQISEAVGHAHQRGVLHRDLKPANILLDENRESELPWCDRVRVADFGLAKLLGEEALDSVSIDNSMIGTPSYMSPEQVRCEEVGPQSDVYSAGIILYEMLTGTAPNKKETYAATIRSIEHDVIPPANHVRKGIPGDLVAICQKCLERRPELRYENATELAIDLERFLSGRPVLAKTPGRLELARRWAARNPVVAICLFVTLISLIAGISFTSISLQSARENEMALKRQLDVMQGIFEDLDANQTGTLVEEFELRDRIASRLIECSEQIQQLSADSSMRSQLLSTFGKALVALGRPNEADQIVSDLMESFGESPTEKADLLRLQLQKAHALQAQMKVSESLSILDSIWSDIITSSTIKPAAKVQVLFSRAEVTLLAGDLTSAKSQYENALQHLGDLELEPAARERLSVLAGFRLAKIGHLVHSNAESLTEFQAAYDDFVKQYRPGHPHVTLAAYEICGSLRQQGEFEKSLQISKRIFRQSKMRYGLANLHTLFALDSLLVTYGSTIDQAESNKELRELIPLIEENTAIIAERLGPEHSNLITFRSNLAYAFSLLGDVENQIRTLRELVQSCAGASEDVQLKLRPSKLRLASALHKRNDFVGAIKLYEEWLATQGSSDNVIGRVSVQLQLEQARLQAQRNSQNEQ